MLGYSSNQQQHVNFSSNLFFLQCDDLMKEYLPVALAFLADEIVSTVIILNIGTDKSEQTVQTQIRLLLMEQSDQGLLCLLFCLHLLNCKIQLFQL